MSDLTEIIIAIQQINHERYDEKDESIYLKYPLDFSTDGFYYKIDFCGYNILDSNNEPRIYYEESDTYEPWISCIRRLMKEHLEYIRKVG
jgi:hypothetical protein